MENLLGSIFGIFQRLSVPPGVIPISPQQLREALCQMLSDPETRPLLLKSIMGEARPAGANDPAAEDVSAGTFGGTGAGGRAENGGDHRPGSGETATALPVLAELPAC